MNARGQPLFGGVELGGTKCVCLIGTGPDDIRTRVSIPTGSEPGATLARIEAELRAAITMHGPIAALGIASFGPVDLARRSPTYGSVTSTAKPGWRNTEIVAPLALALRVPVGFDTDVNAAALAEGRWGAARDVANFAYVTVGTGVGVGLVIGGRPACGFSHSELGHIRVARRPGDAWPGSCIFHGDCVEGLASGSAIRARTAVAAQALDDEHPVWETVADALAQMLHTVMLATAPQRIMIGGGVVEGRPGLLPRVRSRLVASLNGYLDLDALVGNLDGYIVAPGLAALSGPLGALALAADVL